VAEVSLSFDVDGEVGLSGAGWGRRLSSVSERRFGVGRGLARVVGVLERFGVAATFYVPGVIAERYPSAIRELAAAGHEIGHHGYAHLPSHRSDAAAQREEIVRGLAALEDCLGARPLGYRSPAWELTPVTLALLGEHGFGHDSSLMGDDRPYRLDGGLLELPVHWSLDDVPFLAWTPERAGTLGHPGALLDAWIAEHDHAAAEQRHLTYTMHPEITGRGHRVDLLTGLLDHLHTHHTPTYTHTEAARAHE
jgi:peptidoglycan/xylan/chitin deacetylase (PgdA/CDA1 family)